MSSSAASINALAAANCPISVSRTAAWAWMVAMLAAIVAMMEHFVLIPARARSHVAANFYHRSKWTVIISVTDLRPQS